MNDKNFYRSYHSIMNIIVRSLDDAGLYRSFLSSPQFFTRALHFFFAVSGQADSLDEMVHFFPRNSGMVQKGPEIGNTRACEDASTLGSIVLNLVFETSGCFMRLA